MKWNHICHSFIRMAVIGAIASAVNAQTVDPPEKVRERYTLADSVSVVISDARYKAFLYVFDRDKLIWKSPQMAGYFCMMMDSIISDVDQNGTPDFLLRYADCGFACSMGLLVSLDGGRRNSLIHFSPLDQVSTSLRPSSYSAVLESSNELSADLWDLLENYLTRMACNEDARRLIHKFISDKVYTVMKPDSESLPELRASHAAAMKQYRRGQLRGAAGTLELFFDRYDYRRIDPSGTDSSYTMILDDFAFFLLKSKGDFYWTRDLLTYVIARDPERATAHLNLGDLLYRYASTRKDGRESYKRYLELMTERGLQRKVPKRVFERTKT
jgi:hypothetical protein